MIAVGGVLATQALERLPELVVKRYALLFSANPGASVLVRAEMFAESMEIAVHHPIGGVGTGSFGAVARVEPILYPHNIIGELACENGIASGLMMLSAMVLGGVSAFKRAWRTGTPTAWAVLYVVVFCILNSMVSGDLNDNQVMFGFLSIAGATFRPVEMSEVLDR
jgi:O-antigen ligase